MAPPVSYLGHKIDNDGLHPTEEKFKAILEAPEPNNVSELKSYLGVLTYYSKFLSNFTDTLAPLYKLLKSGTQFKWGKNRKTSLQKFKGIANIKKCVGTF